MATKIIEIAEPTTAEEAIEKGYFQISRRFRRIARFPQGKTGKQALLDACKNEANAEQWVEALGERQAGDQFLRVYTDRSLKTTLTAVEFERFRQMGGDTYQG